MNYRILSKIRPGDSQIRYWVQCRKHWWNKWIEAPIIGYWSHCVVKRGYSFMDDEYVARFIMDNLKKYVQKYKGFNIYPIFNWTSDRDDEIVFSYKLKGFTCIKPDYHNCISSDVIQHIFENVEEVKKFIDIYSINNKEQTKILK